MSRLLILGASVLQLPAILRAREMGHHVAVADYNPQAAGIPYADEFFPVSTIDAVAVYRAACAYRPDGIMTLATDMPMRSVAYAAERLGLPGINLQTAIRCTDKYEMIRAFKEHGVDSPRYHLVMNEAELADCAAEIGFPCIMKPRDNAGSRGVILVESPEDLLSSYRYSLARSRNSGGGILIEAYLTGSEVSVETMSWEGKVHVLAITDKLTTGSPHFVEMGHSQPSALQPDVLSAVETLAAAAVRSVGIEYGPAHVEIMVTRQGPRLIELGARMGGDCITTHLVPLSTGIDMVAATIDCALGREPDIRRRFSKGSAIRFLNLTKGTIRSVSGLEEAKLLKGVQEIVLTKQPGETVGNIESSTDRAGYVIAQAEAAAQAVSICDEAIRRLNITIG